MIRIDSAGVVLPDSFPHTVGMIREESDTRFKAIFFLTQVGMVRAFTTRTFS